MTHITQVVVTIKTGNASGADADGPVYLGLGPREFRLNKTGNQFERNKTDTFVLGNTGPPGGAANVSNANENDPLNPTIIEGADLLNSPYNVYIRYESDTKWLVGDVIVEAIGQVGVSFPPFQHTFRVKFGIASPGIWLGKDSGKFLYLQA